MEELFEFGYLPLLEGVGGGGKGLGDGGDCDVGLSGERVDVLDFRGDVLAVEDPDLDQVCWACRSTVSTSLALTLPPSAIALAKL